jgi:non-heme chloroperoxidase
LESCYGRFVATPTRSTSLYLPAQSAETLAPVPTAGIPQLGALNELHHDQRRHRDLLQGLGPRDAETIVFHHGWPLSSDDWDNQLMFFLGEGFRVVAHDRRGHGRSTQTDTGNDMDTYAADLIELAAKLDLRNAVHVGHSTGGGEATHYVARAEPGRVAKLVLIGAVPPVMVKKESNPGGMPIEAFDGYRQAVVANRAQLLSRYRFGAFLRVQPPGCGGE